MDPLYVYDCEVVQLMNALTQQYLCYDVATKKFSMSLDRRDASNFIVEQEQDNVTCLRLDLDGCDRQTA